MSAPTPPAQTDESTTDPIRTTRDALVADGVILCIRQDDAGRAADACEAAAEGGLVVLEVTLTTPGALDLIAKLATRPGLLVGAGTVLTAADAAAVAAAGGRFALSPVLDRDMLHMAGELGVLAIPGATTPTEVRAARQAGADLVKLFPSGPIGGPAYLKAVRGPLPDIPLIPTSGPTSGDMAAWLEAGATAVGVGGEVLPPGWTTAGVTSAASRVREAFDAARAALAAG